MSFFLQGHSAQPLWAHPPPGDPVFPSPITPVMTLFPSKVLHWRRAFHTFLWGRYRCPGVSRAECPVGQAGASPVSRGNPGPCPLPPRLPDLGLRTADPPLCSPPTASPAGLASEASHPVAVSANSLLCAAPPPLLGSHSGAQPWPSQAPRVPSSGLDSGLTI